MSQRSAIDDTFSELTADEALLSDYLDGELSVQERGDTEKRLENEPVLREMLAELEENWRMLDVLERETSDKNFVATTMKMVAVQTEEPASPKFYRFVRTKILLGGIAFMILFVGAFFAGSRVGDKSAALRTAAPILERLDLYLPLLEEDNELLPLLTERRLFLPPKEPQENSSRFKKDSVALFSEQKILHETLEERLVRIENLDDALYARFYDNFQKFQALSPAKQRRLLDLHRAIVAAPNWYEQMLTLQNYHQWRKSLQSYEKTELRKPLPANEKVTQIAELKRRLDANHASDVAPQMAKPEELTVKRYGQTLEMMPDAQKVPLLGEAPERILRTLEEQTAE